MNIEFVDPAEVPLPPEQMSFRALAVEPFPDGQRVGVRLSVTPFQVRPSIDLEVRDERGRMVASSSIIEATDVEMSVTLHLRESPTGGDFWLAAQLHYPEHGQVDRREHAFTIPQQENR